MPDTDKAESASTAMEEHDTTPSQDPHIEHEEDYTFPSGRVNKAIRHEFLRAELLQRAEAICKWTHPQPHGEGLDDRTAPVEWPADQKMKGTNALSAAAKVFRETTGMLSWSSRAGSETFNDYILANLPAELKARNTTRGWRNISKAEIVTIREPAIGSRPENSRKRSSPGDPNSTVEGDSSATEELTDDDTVNNSAMSVDIPRELESGRRYPHRAWKSLTSTMPSAVLSPRQEVENIQKLFSEKYEASNPGEGKAPTLMHLTSWPGGIQDWWSAKYWDGSAQYRIKEDGTIGSRYSLESIPGEALNEEPVGGDAEGSHGEAQRSSSQTLEHTDAPSFIEEGNSTVHQPSYEGDLHYGSGGLPDRSGTADQEKEQAGETRLVSTRSETMKSNHQDLESS
ncbi:MAG: hypothetical protein Q9226_007775 [Calogaya cf. arnoldii]